MSRQHGFQIPIDAPGSTLAIIEEVALKHGLVSRKQLLQLDRSRRMVAARQEVMYRLRYERGLTYPAIARIMLRDHTTVIHGVRQHIERAKKWALARKGLPVL